MTAPHGLVRIGSGLVVVAVVVAVFLIGRPGDDEDGTGPSAVPPSPSAPTPTAIPSAVRTEDFCTAFRTMAAAHANHLANDTEQSLLEVSAAASNLLRLEPGTVMPPGARQGLRELVDGVLGESTTAPDEAAADALTGFLEVSCPAGAF